MNQSSPWATERVHAPHDANGSGVTTPASAGGFYAASSFHFGIDASAPASAGHFFPLSGLSAVSSTFSTLPTVPPPARTSDQQHTKKRGQSDGDDAPAFKKANYGI